MLARQGILHAEAVSAGPAAAAGGAPRGGRGRPRVGRRAPRGRAAVVPPVPVTPRGRMALPPAPPVPRGKDEVSSQPPIITDARVTTRESPTDRMCAPRCAG